VFNRLLQDVLDEKYDVKINVACTNDKFLHVMSGKHVSPDRQITERNVCEQQTATARGMDRFGGTEIRAGELPATREGGGAEVSRLRPLLVLLQYQARVWRLSEL
jgi:hypothetical protein